MSPMAEHRARLADKSRTPLAGDKLDLKNGDSVEVYRKSAQKDRPGWIGPATVADLADMERGKVTARWQGRRIAVPVESLRRVMVHLTLFLDVFTVRIRRGKVFQV